MRRDLVQPATVSAVAGGVLQRLTCVGRADRSEQDRSKAEPDEEFKAPVARLSGRAARAAQQMLTQFARLKRSQLGARLLQVALSRRS